MATTAVHLLPYPGAGDPAAGHTQIQALADRVEAVLETTVPARYGPITSQVVWLPCTAFAAASGAPAFVVGFQPFLMFDAATMEAAASTAYVPPYWVSYSAELWWINGGAGVGDVRWTYFPGGTIDGGDLGVLGTSASATVATPTGALVKKTTIATGLTVVNGIATVYVRRDAADGADTLANDAGLVGVLLRRAT